MSADYLHANEERRTLRQAFADALFHAGVRSPASTLAVIALSDALSGSGIESSAVDWRVLGGVIPGPIPVEWVQVGDTIQDHGVTGTITRATRCGGMVHLAIGSGHVSFAKVARQDFITVLSSNHADGSVR